MAGRVEGRVAIVTGAAKGIGTACARRLAEEGAPVALADIDEAGGTALAAELEAAGGKAMFVPLDVTKEAEWEAAVAAVTKRFGGLDILVNNAGIAIIEPVQTTTFEDWRRIMAVNADGVFLGTKHAMRVMRNGGSIINISSILGITSVEALSAYSATKGAVRLFSKGAALDGAKDGKEIRVNSLHPGYIHTEMMEDTCYRDYGSLEAGLAELGKLHPIGRVGEPEDIANGVLFLASEESSFITGTELVIDGGYTAV
jgi:NAD(P)-dependent dehydrogenase (short-subunit alcohol dehydrogenase family)